MKTDVHIGQTVLIVDGYQGEKLRLGVVFGETKTSWRVKSSFGEFETKQLYFKDTLQLRGRGAWGRGRLKEFNEQEWKEYSETVKQKRYAQALSQFDWSVLPLEKLKKIYATAKDAV